MTKRGHTIVEISIGLLLTGWVVWGFVNKEPFLEKTSLRTYDTFTKFRPPSEKIEKTPLRIVEINDEDLANIGRWPWPRAVTAELVDAVVAAGARVIGLNMFFTEESQNQGLEEIAELHEQFSEILDSHRHLFRRKRIKTDEFDAFLTDMEEIMDGLDGDAILAQSIEEGSNIVLPMYFVPGEPLGNNLDPLPDTFTGEKLSLASGGLFPDVPSALHAQTPIDAFAIPAIAIGHSNLDPDRDGRLRRMTPIMRYGQDDFPSFGLQVVREYLETQREALKWLPGKGFQLHKALIPTDKGSHVFLEYAGPAGTFETYSAIDVLSDGIPEGALDNAIVLVGVTAPGAGGETYVGPSGERYNGLEIWANHIENILNQRFITRPPWAENAEWGMIGIAALILLVALPFLRARFSIPVAAFFVLGSVGGCLFSFVKEGLWISPAYGCFLLAAGFVILVGKRLIFTEKGKELVEAEGVETNKMLGLSFQGQGMLDLAFEKFRRVPIDAQIKDLLYNLGLDMERKRMFSKAAAVFEHIATVDPKYKNIQEKITLLKKAGEGAVFGGIGKKGSDATVVVEGMDQHTTLGRYEVVRELGRGAMGVVYLGKDPKINRQVAIKTLRFEDEVDEDQAKSIKERFFREAESAGNLTHPNIIRIFDAGEDQEVAYIAMELLEGKDLKEKCEKAKLLPFKRTVEMMINVADALDYAHAQGVVHRDIKPANIMLLKDDTLRITDFGIARIQATSKTATGAVLGTPAYMSPEQVNGKKVDGRADIFSLGVTFFELLTGEKPFQADSIAALLYRIANVDHPDPREYNPAVPAALIPILNKALAKEPGQRYQKAGEMANDLRSSLSHLNDTSPLPQAPPPQSAPPPPPSPSPRPPSSPQPVPAPSSKPAVPPTPLEEPDVFGQMEKELRENFDIDAPKTPPKPVSTQESVPIFDLGEAPAVKPASEIPPPDSTVVIPPSITDQTVIDERRATPEATPPQNPREDHKT